MKHQHAIIVPALAILFSANDGRLFAESGVDFNRDIRPILARNCFACHGPDEEAREADLRLDSLEGATADLGDCAAIVPGKPDESELIARVESDDADMVMPPSDSAHQLTKSDKEQLRKWIDSGAEYATHWSFVAPKKSELPAVKSADWPQHPLDHFVLARLESADLQPADEADRYRLIRRVSLDLTGLPPTPEEADAFANDNSPDAFEKVVDRLLASDAYGEHWARMWLDLARYADTRGYEKDRHRDIWMYRDWVIRALNDDMPFDQFTIEQLAGDLLSDPKENQIIATAFHRNTMSNDEGGTDDEEFRVAAVKDRVDTTLQVWMGLTMGCAKCHSHKYDPISQADYYSVYAFFNQTEDADRNDERPVWKSPTPEQKKQVAELEAEVKKAEKELKAISDKEPAEAKPEAEKNTNKKSTDEKKTDEEKTDDKETDDKETDEKKPEDVSPKKKAAEAKLEAARNKLKEAKAAITKTPIMRELPADKQRETRIHQRGNFLDPGEAVQPAVPDIFGSYAEDMPVNRHGVAQWILQSENPLTARVMVNRIWARLFGVGIVETEEDFGTQGLPPTHPQLLDWLAVDFRENGWSLKKLLRSIVLSSTYRQSSVVTKAKLAADPNNRLLSRGSRFRLPAETVRDQALAVSGLLTKKIGGQSVMPPQPEGVWKSTYNELTWQDASDEDRYRRGLYTYWKRTSPYPSMTTFDAGSGEVCQVRRVRTNTPLQALVTLNDTAFVEAAGALANRMTERDRDLTVQIKHGFRLVLTRPPSENETARLVELYSLLSDDFAKDKPAADELVKAARLKQGNAAMIAVANVILNLDETLMKP